MARQTVKKITLLDVELVAFVLAEKLMEGNEPIPDFNTRFENRLESCVVTPFQLFSGKSLYKGLKGKAAILFYLMIKNHPFENGNKRIAVTTLLYFLYKNGKWLRVPSFDLYKFAQYVAKSRAEKNKQVVKEIENFIESNLIKA